VTTQEDTGEICELLRTLEYEIHDIFYQKRPLPDPRYFIGKGKVTEIRESLTQDNPDIMAVNGKLKPNQRFNLEQELGIEVYDRIRIILEIFRKRAVSEEAKLQVELATLSYEFPWIRELIHRTRLGEHPGLLGGGEYQTRQYYTQARRRARSIRKRLVILERNRDMMRRNRHRKGFTLVNITGYTNAGKSTLFNALTNESVLVDDRMFATLSTTTRRFGRKQPKILLTDTVGFIENLPPWMIKAFNATMEEIYQSDIVVLVIDGTDSDSEIVRKVDTCLEMIRIEERERVIIAALNKTDLMEAGEAEDMGQWLREQFPTMDVIMISAKDRTGLTDLGERIFSIHESMAMTRSVRLNIPNNDRSASFVNWLYEMTIVKENVHRNGFREIVTEVPVRFVQEFTLRCREAEVSSNSEADFDEMES